MTEKKTGFRTSSCSQVNFLRLGRPSSIHPDVIPFTDGHLSRDFKEPSQLKELYDQAVNVFFIVFGRTSQYQLFQPAAVFRMKRY